MNYECENVRLTAHIYDGDVNLNMQTHDFMQIEMKEIREPKRFIHLNTNISSKKIAFLQSMCDFNQYTQILMIAFSSVFLWEKEHFRLLNLSNAFPILIQNDVVYFTLYLCRSVCDCDVCTHIHFLFKC